MNDSGETVQQRRRGLRKYSQAKRPDLDNTLESHIFYDTDEAIFLLRRESFR